MSIWARIFTGASWFSVDGPIGGLARQIWTAASDIVAGPDGAELDDDPRAATQQLAFTMAAIALGAKMAKADGQVTDEEVAAFSELFHVPPREQKNMARVFRIAQQSVAGYESYARQVAKLFEHHPPVLEELLDALFHIAVADGVIHPDEMDYLYNVAGIFGLDSAAFARVKAVNIDGRDADPYEILGADRGMPSDQLRKLYLELIRLHHPDRLIAEGAPPEFVALANEKLAAINAAYENITGNNGEPSSGQNSSRSTTSRSTGR